MKRANIYRGVKCDGSDIFLEGFSMRVKTALVCPPSNPRSEILQWCLSVTLTKYSIKFKPNTLSLTTPSGDTILDFNLIIAHIYANSLSSPVNLYPNKQSLMELNKRFMDACEFIYWNGISKCRPRVISKCQTLALNSTRAYLIQIFAPFVKLALQLKYPDSKVDPALVIVKETFKKMEGRLKNAYLTGEKISMLDISFAVYASLALFAQVDHFGIYVPEPHDLDKGVRDRVKELRKSRIGNWIMWIFDERVQVTGAVEWEQDVMPFEVFQSLVYTMAGGSVILACFTWGLYGLEALLFFALIASCLIWYCLERFMLMDS